MQERILKRRATRAFLNVTLVSVWLITYLTALHAQTSPSRPIRLFRLEGTFSEELAAKISSDDKQEHPKFTLTRARLEADSLGALTRLRAILTIANDDPTLRITAVEWRIDIFDASLRSASTRLIQAEKINIYPGETGVASDKFAAVLPDRMIVLLQVVRVSFVDGSAWSTTELCSLGKDLRTIACDSR